MASAVALNITNEIQHRVTFVAQTARISVDISMLIQNPTIRNMINSDNLCSLQIGFGDIRSESVTVRDGRVFNEIDSESTPSPTLKFKAVAGPSRHWGLKYLCDVVAEKAGSQPNGTTFICWCRQSYPGIDVLVEVMDNMEFVSEHIGSPLDPLWGDDV